MSRMQSKAVRVGALVTTTTAIVVFVVFFLGGQGHLFGDKVQYKVMFRSTSGLFKGDPVLLTGVEVGNVSKIGFPGKIEEKRILLEIAVDKAVANRIRRDTRARLGLASLVYGKVVELTMGSPEEPAIPTGGYIQSEEGTQYQAIVDSTSLMLEDARRILAKINRGEGALGLMLNRPMELPETLHSLALSVHRLSTLIERVNRGQGPLGAVLADTTDFRRTLRDIQATVSDVRLIASRLKDNRSLAGRLINDAPFGDSVLRNLHSAVRSLASVTAKIDTGEGTLGLLVNDPSLYIGLENVVLGVEKSSVARWMIQNRRKAGERERNKIEQQAAKPGQPGGKNNQEP